MTDNEIIKALECCTYHHGRCTSCPLYAEVTTVCKEKKDNYVLDLINRQKAEIERLQKNIDGLNIFTKNHIKVIRLQAIKEFAERLKIEIISDTAYGCDCNQHSGYYDNTIKIGDIPEYIDDLVKEMTEVNENDDT